MGRKANRKAWTERVQNSGKWQTRSNGREYHERKNDRAQQKALKARLKAEAEKAFEDKIPVTWLELTCPMPPIANQDGAKVRMKTSLSINVAINKRSAWNGDVSHMKALAEGLRLRRGIPDNYRIAGPYAMLVVVHYSNRGSDLNNLYAKYLIDRLKLWVVREDNLNNNVLLTIVPHMIDDIQKEQVDIYLASLAPECAEDMMALHDQVRNRYLAPAAAGARKDKPQLYFNQETCEYEERAD